MNKKTMVVAFSVESRGGYNNQYVMELGFSEKHACPVNSKKNIYLFRDFM